MTILTCMRTTSNTWHQTVRKRQPLNTETAHGVTVNISDYGVKGLMISEYLFLLLTSLKLFYPNIGVTFEHLLYSKEKKNM